MFTDRLDIARRMVVGEVVGNAVPGLAPAGPAGTARGRTA